ncbi:energy transducer TonB [Oceanispirochaeta crateris]|nr:energy transducer TonB [Oceanispirochaeta crateris]
MIFQFWFREPIGRALLVSLSLHVVLLALIVRLNPPGPVVTSMENQRVKVNFLSIERESAEEESPVLSKEHSVVSETVPIIQEIPPAPPEAKVPAPVEASSFPDTPADLATPSEPEEIMDASDSAALLEVQPGSGNTTAPTAFDSGALEPFLDELDLEGSRMPAPVYPSMAKQMAWEGDVLITFTINSKGRAEDIVIDQSSGHELLDQSVLTTVKKHWRFPKGRDPLRVRKEFSFRLI